MATSVSVPVAAADPVPAVDPGPVGDFGWNGFNWKKRFWSGAPNYSKQFAAANVSNPDTNGHVTMTLSNPTGQAPVGAEFSTTRQGFGYGTYSTTIEKDLTTLQDEVVWGCLFTYDPAAAPGFNEIDLCEASAWGGGGSYNENWPVTQGHGYWFDASKAPGLGNDTVTFDVTTNPVLTHRMVWEPNKLTFETFAGEGYTGPLLKRTVLQGENVPEPAHEAIHFNLWVTGGGGGDPAHVKPEQVVVRDFSFLPAVAQPVVTPTPTPTPTPTATPTVAPTPTPTVAPTPTPAITLAATNSKSGPLRSTTLTWTGAQGSTVSLVADGVRRVVPNTGRYTATTKTSSVRYQVCDATRCSPVVLGAK